MKIVKKAIYNFSPDNEAELHADIGEILVFETMDCFSGTVKTEADTMETTDYSIANPAAGPVYFEEAEVGDVLAVDILDIEVADRGVITTSKNCGPISDEVELRTKVINIKDGYAQFNNIKFPVSPMIGVIGTAPKEGKIADGYPGNHGGNMDSKLIKKGARVYFPVRTKGALLQMGDVHAAMGDSELCGTGIEIAAKITVKTSLIKNFELNWPVTETFDHWYVNACADDYPEALKLATKELQRLIMNVSSWDETDTYMFMSVNCDLEINQACKPCEVPLIVRFGMPKNTYFAPLIK